MTQYTAGFQFNQGWCHPASRAVGSMHQKHPGSDSDDGPKGSTERVRGGRGRQLRLIVMTDPQDQCVEEEEAVGYV